MTELFTLCVPVNHCKDLFQQNFHLHTLLRLSIWITFVGHLYHNYNTEQCHNSPFSLNRMLSLHWWSVFISVSFSSFQGKWGTAQLSILQKQKDFMHQTNNVVTAAVIVKVLKLHAGCILLLLSPEIVYKNLQRADVRPCCCASPALPLLFLSAHLRLSAFICFLFWKLSNQKPQAKAIFIWAESKHQLFQLFTCLYYTVLVKTLTHIQSLDAFPNHNHRNNMLNISPSFNSKLVVISNLYPKTKS